ncbi:tyrosine-type recombinase/integrase [Clostridium oryzae]|uniref:Tyrosine recombinase XerD n=1 Tax=Clostridium oryzae TaxID=1450648 RepID=A0A1V4IT41_9CLOT|nr:tyrosine-type recombinase/integrase [Clostridium oryzae]OPJ63188.1 tyrosine recombinase XerD [Clostridium oryzae]
MHELIDKYLDYINKTKNLSMNTTDAYKRDIYKFEQFLELDNRDFFSADVTTVTKFIQHLSKMGKKDASIARNVICIRNFYKFLIKYGYIDKSDIVSYEIPKFKRKSPEILTIDEVNKLLAVPDTTTFKGIRDKAMLEMMYATGLKITELLSIEIDDINFDFNYVKVKESNNFERIIPIGSYCVEWLKKYIEMRKEINDNKTLFLNVRGSSISRQGFWKILKHYAEQAHIDKDINLYTLRHSIAVHLIQNGADIQSLKELMGYKELSAIQIYMDIIKKNRLMEVYKNTHPRA